MPFSGWCGPTIIKIILSTCEIKKSIWEIALYVYKWWWGTPPQLFVAYLSKFFSLVNYKTNARTSDISFHLKARHIVVINWWDGDEGHYSIVSKCEKGLLDIVDTTRERPWLWKMTTKELKRVWYDTLTMDNSIYHENFMIWIDPNSKRNK